MNINEAIHWAANSLESADLCYGHGTDNAWDEAAWLVLHAIGLSPADPIEDEWQALDQAQQHAVEQIIQQRIHTRKPAAYLTQQAWFCGYAFHSDERALVPRSPIAELIQNNFSPWLAQTPRRILDLCTGGGCIAIACAHQFPDSDVVGVDLSDDALELAKLNVEMHQLASRVELVKSDLFASVTGKFDLIVSNPPYVDLEDMTALADEFTHEPRFGLESGEDGLDATRVILNQAKSFLSDSGVLIVEVGNSQEALVKAFPELPFVWLEFEYGGHGVFALNASDL